MENDYQQQAEDEEYEVFVMKQDFKFHCAHFVAFKGYRERLHGHNYTVGVRMTGTRRGHDGYLIDFGDIKKVTRALCKELNEHFICPMKSNVIQIKIDDDKGQIELACEDGAHFSFPKGDCAMLPIVHSTAEELAQYLWHRIIATFCVDRLLDRGIHTLQIKVAEAPQQEGSYTRRLISTSKIKVAEAPQQEGSYIRRLISTSKEAGDLIASKPSPCLCPHHT